MYTNTVIMASQRENTRIQIQALNKSKLSVKEIVSVLLRSGPTVMVIKINHTLAEKPNFRLEQKVK